MKFSLIRRDNGRRILIADFKNYLTNEIKIQKIYQQFGVPHVSDVHPFARANFALMNGKSVPRNLFPSITISILNENEHSKNVIGNTTKQSFEQDELDDFKNLALEERLLSDSQITVLQNLVDNLDPSKSFTLNVTRDLEQFKVVFSIWVDNFDVKEDLYNITKVYIKQKVDFFQNTLCWNEMVWSGERDGIYNIEFGAILYGATLTINASRMTVDLEVETDISLADELLVVTEGVNDTGDFTAVPKGKFKTFTGE